MSLPRSTFPNRPADLDFSMKVPVGFVGAGLQGLECGIGCASEFECLLELSSPSAFAAITVMGGSGFAAGTVRERVVSLCPDCGITLLSIGPGYVGGLRKNHPAILFTGLHRLQSRELVISLVAMEDGGRLVLAQALCTRDLEPSFMRTLETCIYSIELLRHKGPTLNLDDNGGKYDIEIIDHEADLPSPESEAEVFARKQARAREEAVERARPMIAADRFDEAAMAVLSADDSGQGRAALSELFLEALREQVRKDGKGKPAKARALELYRRALHHRLSTYPDPHTQEEADRYSSGMDEDRAEIEAVLGYRPEEKT